MCKYKEQCYHCLKSRGNMENTSNEKKQKLFAVFSNTKSRFIKD